MHADGEARRAVQARLTAATAQMHERRIRAAVIAAPALGFTLAAQICVSQEGFDRAEIHRRFNADVIEYFKKFL